MASNDTPTMMGFGGQYPVRVCELTLTVPTAGNSATATSTSKFRGAIENIEIDPGSAMSTSATLKGYEAHTALATGTRDHFLNYTFPESEVELVFYPMVLTTLNTGAETTATYDGTRVIKTFTKYVVNDNLRVDLASATAGDSVTVRIYVRG